MWLRLNKLIKPNGAIVLFGSEPFSSALRMSNIKNYKYDWVWEKEQGTGQLNAKIMPLKNHETISIFSNENFKKTPYYPQMTISDKCYSRNDVGKVNNQKDKVYGKSSGYSVKNIKTRYPKTVQKFNRVKEKGQHPTQKPVALIEYLVKTYTNEGELVLDFTIGSGTTAVACVNTGRNFIGIEKDEGYYKIATDRINKRIQELKPLDELF